MKTAMKNLKSDASSEAFAKSIENQMQPKDGFLRINSMETAKAFGNSKNGRNFVDMKTAKIELKVTAIGRNVTVKGMYGPYNGSYAGLDYFWVILQLGDKVIWSAPISKKERERANSRNEDAETSATSFRVWLINQKIKEAGFEGVEVTYNDIEYLALGRDVKEEPEYKALDIQPILDSITSPEEPTPSDAKSAEEITKKAAEAAAVIISENKESILPQSAISGASPFSPPTQEDPAEGVSSIIEDVKNKTNIQLEKFQAEGVNFIDKNLACILADDMGVGKTFQVLGWVAFKEAKNILIIAPANVIKKWATEAQMAFPGCKISLNEESVGGWEAPSFRIYSYDTFTRKKYIPICEVDLLVLDEAHYVKNRGSQRSQKVFDFLIENYDKISRLVMLSGTLIPNKPIDMIAPLRLLDVFIYKKTGKALGIKYKDLYGILQSTGTYLPAHLEIVKKAIEALKMHSLARKKDEVLSLPPIKRKVFSLEDEKSFQIANEIDNLVRRILIDRGLPHIAEKMFRSELSDREWRMAMREVMRFGGLGEMARLRHDEAYAKALYAANKICEVVDSNEPIIIFYHHKDAIEAFNAYSPRKVEAKIDGSVSAAKRHEIVSRFQAGHIKTLAVSITSGAEGVNLTAANKAFFIEVDWQIGKLLQAEGRIWRYGQKSTTYAYYLQIPSAIDKHIYRLLSQKKNSIQRIGL